MNLHSLLCNTAFLSHHYAESGTRLQQISQTTESFPVSLHRPPFCQTLLFQSLFFRTSGHHLTKDIAVTEPFLLAQSLPLHAQDGIYRITQMNTSSKGSLKPAAIFALSFCKMELFLKWKNTSILCLISLGSLVSN